MPNSIIGNQSVWNQCSDSNAYCNTRLLLKLLHWCETLQQVNIKSHHFFDYLNFSKIWKKKKCSFFKAPPSPQIETTFTQALNVNPAQEPVYILKLAFPSFPTLDFTHWLFPFEGWMGSNKLSGDELRPTASLSSVELHAISSLKKSTNRNNCLRSSLF